MTIESKIDRTNELLESLVKLLSTGTISKETVSDAELFGKQQSNTEAEKPKRKRRTRKEMEADAAAPAKQDNAEPTVSRDDVKAALIKYRDAKGGDAMKKLLSDFGADALSLLAPENYGAIVQKSKELLDSDDEDDDDDI